MTLQTTVLDSLLAGAFLPNAIDVVSERHDLSSDAVTILLVVAELHAKNQATPSLERVICQTYYAPSHFLEEVDELHKGEFLIRDGDRVAATDKAAQLLNAVHKECQQQLQYRATRYNTTATDAPSRLVHDEKRVYCEPESIGFFPLVPLIVYSLPAKKVAKPAAPKRRKQAEKLSSEPPAQG